eukprot:TRINITY_DN81067_c0_g1_i1.p1 TRINITY_DN81067_c0_g1~~TRINITY_DN81067_c0_g1_i1.p1  ORF type:complete len:651 (-),score=108.21 TRINITY_DN81067_c0_g1_i1:67-2019(-)
MSQSLPRPEHYPTTRPDDVRHAAKLDAKFRKQILEDEEVRTLVASALDVVAEAVPLVSAGDLPPVAQGMSSKIVHIVRHGNGVHNVMVDSWAELSSLGGSGHIAAQALFGLDATRTKPAGPSYAPLVDALRDAPLTERGRQEASATSRQAEASGVTASLLVVSPMRRAAETGIVVFPKATRIVAHDALHECSGLYPWDRRRDLEEIRADGSLKGVDWSLIQSEECPWWNENRRETDFEMTRRLIEFMRWMRDQPDKEISIASHSHIIHVLLLCGLLVIPDGATTPNGMIADSWFVTGEMRSFSLTWKKREADAMAEKSSGYASSSDGIVAFGKAEKKVVPRILENGAGAEAELKADGTVVARGPSDRGGDCSAVQEQLVDVQCINATFNAYAALKADGSVVAWGSEWFGGGESFTEVQSQLVDVQSIHATDKAFAALKAGGTVVSWGAREGPWAESLQKAQLLLINVQQIFSTTNAFAALKADGTVVAWGDWKYGGSLRKDLVDVKHIVPGDAAFAALKADGTVTVWGDSKAGGEPWIVGSCGTHHLDGQLVDIEQIFSSGLAFAALKAGGHVVAWGWDSAGGDCRVLEHQLVSVKHIYAINGSEGMCRSSGKMGRMGGAFAALKFDGSVVTWGNPNYQKAAEVLALKHA